MGELSELIAEGMEREEVVAEVAQLEQRIEELDGRLDGLRDDISNTPSIFEGDNAIEVAQWFMQAIDKALAQQEE